jgi:hypothetical protein
MTMISKVLEFIFLTSTMSFIDLVFLFTLKSFFGFKALKNEERFFESLVSCPEFPEELLQL